MNGYAVDPLVWCSLIGGKIVYHRSDLSDRVIAKKCTERCTV